MQQLGFSFMVNNKASFTFNSQVCELETESRRDSEALLWGILNNVFNDRGKAGMQRNGCNLLNCHHSHPGMQQCEYSSNLRRLSLWGTL